MYKNDNESEKVSLYIDFRNIEGGLRTAFPRGGVVIDYKMLVCTILKDRLLVNAYVFDGFF